MVSMIDNVIQKSQIYYTRLSKWKGKVDLDIRVGPYVLQVARTPKQVLECFKLRHQVFCVEMAANPKPSRLDFDQYDNFCDHLIIVHEPSNKIVGTYRLNYSGTAEEFYTQSEFDMLDWVKTQNAPFIELGRACIEKGHRRGAVITLLFRGIMEYMKAMKAQKLFGCSSLTVTDARSAALVYKYFEVKGLLADKVVRPHNSYEMKDLFFWLLVFSKGLTDEQMLEAEEKIPSLLNVYLKAGAKVASYPAYDADFKCIDFVTILDQADMAEKHAKKFSS